MILRACKVLPNESDIRYNWLIQFLLDCSGHSAVLQHCHLLASRERLKLKSKLRFSLLCMIRALRLTLDVDYLRQLQCRLMKLL